MPRSRPPFRASPRSAQPDPPAPTPSAGPRFVRAVPTLGLVALVTFYVALKSYQLNLSDSDENIYFYMALRTAFGGLLPYRDYFFAHPPLHLAFAVVALELGALVHGAAAM